MATRNYSTVTVTMSEYVNQFVSSVEAIGAALISNGNCSLDESSIEINVSIRTPSSKGWNKKYSIKRQYFYPNNYV